MRSVDTRFWADGWVRKLNALDRYVFLYLLTNDHTNWCGVYELDMSMMAFESGVDEHDLTRSILPRLAPKAVYVEGWVYLQNYPKYHLNGTDATKKGYEKALSQVPEKIRLRIKGIEENGVVPPTHPSLASAFTSSSAFISVAPATLVYEVASLEENGRAYANTPALLDEATDLWREVNPLYKNWYTSNKTERTALDNLLTEEGLDWLKNIVPALPKTNGIPFFPTITKPSVLYNKRAEFKGAVQRHQTPRKTKGRGFA